MTLIRRDFEVEAPLERAWEFLARVSEWPSWATHIRSIDIEPAGSLRLGSKGRIRLRNGMQSGFVVVEFNPGSNWKWVGPFLWLNVHYDHRFERVAAGRTRLTWVVDAEGPGVGTVGPLFAMIYRRSMDRAIPLLIAQMQGDTVSENG